MKFTNITIDPALNGGQPCVKGTRIPVYAILELLQEGFSFDHITKDYYPDLTHNDIKACIQYATQLVKTEEVYTT